MLDTYSTPAAIVCTQHWFFILFSSPLTFHTVYNVKHTHDKTMEMYIRTTYFFIATAKNPATYATAFAENVQDETNSVQIVNRFRFSISYGRICFFFFVKIRLLPPPPIAFPGSNPALFNRKRPRHLCNTLYEPRPDKRVYKLNLKIHYRKRTCDMICLINLKHGFPYDNTRMGSEIELLINPGGSE